MTRNVRGVADIRTAWYADNTRALGCAATQGALA